MPSTSTLVDSIYTRRVSAGECYPPDLVKSRFIKSVDERTQLAGANRLEILLFSLGKDRNSGREETFGVNVFGSSTFHLDSRIFPAGLAIR